MCSGLKPHTTRPAVEAEASLDGLHPSAAVDADFMTYEDGAGNAVICSASIHMVRLDLPANYRLVIPNAAGALKIGMYVPPNRT